MFLVIQLHVGANTSFWPMLKTGVLGIPMHVCRLHPLCAPQSMSDQQMKVQANTCQLNLASTDNSDSEVMPGSSGFTLLMCKYAGSRRVCIQFSCMR